LKKRFTEIFLIYRWELKGRGKLYVSNFKKKVNFSQIKASDFTRYLSSSLRGKYKSLESFTYNKYIIIPFYRRSGKYQKTYKVLAIKKTRKELKRTFLGILQLRLAF